MALHIAMHQRLQVYVLLAQGSDNDIGAHAFFQRHIAHRVGQGGVGGVVAQGFADLAAGGLHNGRSDFG